MLTYLRVGEKSSENGAKFRKKRKNNFEISQSTHTRRAACLASSCRHSTTQLSLPPLQVFSRRRLTADRAAVSAAVLPRFPLLLSPPRDLRSPTRRVVSALQVLLDAAEKKTQIGVCLGRRRGGLVAAAAGIGELDAEAEVNGNSSSESQ